METVLESWPAAKPLVKWTGGKGAELGRIASLMPPRPKRLLEPFVGGGAVLFAMPASVPAEVNDISENLVDLYRFQAGQYAGLHAAMLSIDAAWRAVGAIERGLPDQAAAARAAAAAAPLGETFGRQMADTVRFRAERALRRKRTAVERFRTAGNPVEDPSEIMASALKAAVYEAIRSAFNEAPRGVERAALFWFLRDFCYGGMFRVNAAGGFNVPYGGLSYDARSVAARLDQLATDRIAARLSATRFHNLDFERFLDAAAPRAGDFLFLDPPYDSPFSTYDGRPFSRADHTRLSEVLPGLDCDWMLVISETEFVRDTYCGLPGISVSGSRKTYQGGIKGRYDKRVNHLAITNY